MLQRDFTINQETMSTDIHFYVAAPPAVSISLVPPRYVEEFQRLSHRLPLSDLSIRTSLLLTFTAAFLPQFPNRDVP